MLGSSPEENASEADGAETSQDRIWRMTTILPASETGGKTSLAEVPIPFPACSVAGD